MQPRRRFAAGAGHPLDGRTSAPSAWQVGTRHEFTARPSTRTVQAPHSPSPQPSLVPVSAEILAQVSSSRFIGGDVDGALLAVDLDACVFTRAPS